MKMSKRGMSDVITTVLIILLVLAAIVIIWTFVKPAIDRVGNVDSAKCTGINLKPVKCEYQNGTTGVLQPSATCGMNCTQDDNLAPPGCGVSCTNDDRTPSGCGVCTKNAQGRWICTAACDTTARFTQYKVQAKLESKKEDYIIKYKILADLSNGNRDNKDISAADLPNEYGIKSSPVQTIADNGFISVKSTTLMPIIRLKNEEDFTCPEATANKVNCDDRTAPLTYTI